MEDQGRRAVAWMDGPDYKPVPLFDIGVGTSVALRRVKDGVPAAEAGGRAEGDNGNGSLMCILPVALVGIDLQPSQLAWRASRASCVTHGHPRSRAACVVYCVIVQGVLAGELNRDVALERAFALAKTCVEPKAGHELDVGAATWAGRAAATWSTAFWSA